MAMITPSLTRYNGPTAERQSKVAAAACNNRETRKTRMAALGCFSRWFGGHRSF
jgi:hypothetical protein